MAPPTRRSPVRAARKSGAARARVFSGVFVAAAGPPGRTPTNSTVSLSNKQSRRKKKGASIKTRAIVLFLFWIFVGVSSRSSSLADVCALSPMFAPQMLESSRRRRQRGRKRNAIKLLIRGKNGRRGARRAGGRCRHCRAAHQCAGERAGPAPPPTPSHPTPRPSLRGWTAAVAAAS